MAESIGAPTDQIPLVPCATVTKDFPRRALVLGVDSADITPRHPVPLAGFATRADLDPATETMAPLRLRTLVFGSGAERVILISADVLWWGTDTAARVQQEISRRYGVPTESIMLHATHNHSGPQTSYRFVPLLGEPDPTYIDHLCGTAADSVGRALGTATEVRVQRTVTSVAIGVDRRWARSGGSADAEPIDSDVTVVRFTADDGPGALLVHHACHPVVHHGNAVTSDFVGAAMDELEARHPGVTAVYVQGCCGNVNPNRYRQGVFHDGGQDAVDRLGHELADAVDTALAEPMTALSRVPLHSRSWQVDVPVARVPATAHLREQALKPGLAGQWARLLLEHPERLTQTVPVTFSWAELADGLALLGMSGEPVSTYGLQVKADSAGAVLPLGYTNGMTGYLVTARQLAEGGYEPAEAPYYFGLPAPLAPEAETVVRGALRDAVCARS